MKTNHLLAKTTIALCATLYLTSCREMEPEKAVGASAEAKVNVVAPETAYPGEDGITKRGRLFGKEITYSEIDGKAVFEGDIILTPEQLGQNTGARTQAFTKIHSLWPNNFIQYIVDPSISDDSAILAAIADVEAATPLRFIRRRSLADIPGYQFAQTSYVTFTRSRGYSSSIGRIGGQQFIGIPFFPTKGGILHEIGHTAGLLHEHTRYDRNANVKVNLNNVAEAAKPNFTILDNEGYDNRKYGSFDFGSIMMLDSYAYSQNGQPVMTTLDNKAFTVQRSQLSVGDAQCITAMYSNVFAVTPTGILAGDAATGKNAPLATLYTGAGEIYALKDQFFLSQGNKVTQIRSKSGWAYNVTSGTGPVNGMTYYKGNIFTLQDGSVWKTEATNCVRQQYTGPFFSGGTALAYAFGLPYAVVGDRLHIISIDGKNNSVMGYGYSGVTEMVGWKAWLYVIKPNGKLYKVNPTNGDIVQHGTTTFSSNAQLTCTGKNLLVVSQGTLYSIDEAGITKPISGGWGNVTDISAVNSEDQP
ncbi:M12 family metallopeptidase [Dyadobacter sp. CY327]|uniref:M12 family metallopeptidase n=1 Tax=Dyadobacter sp. CY327 TaxID=2907301 RepID=UPI001F2EEA6F|nr:M12 family metallopeptidase [Dyadobacter sp. CY327]MCE7073163.1 M12 family metallopeptidase [Dyadobacter sp. CY327]